MGVGLPGSQASVVEERRVLGGNTAGLDDEYQLKKNMAATFQIQIVSLDWHITSKFSMELVAI